MQQNKNEETLKIFKGFDLKNKHMVLLGLMITLIGFWGLLSYITGQESYAQQASPPTTDFFLLECNEIEDKVNDLLNSKGPIQKNLVAIKEMIFLMDLYEAKCPIAG
jgi:hypothetical protein